MLAPTTLSIPQRHMGGALPYLSSMGVDGAHHTVWKVSAPTTLLAFCHVREVVGYCPVGVQGTVFDIAVDMSALPYFSSSISWSFLSGRPRSVGPNRLRLRQLEKSSEQGFVASLVGDMGQSWKRCLARPSSRRGRPEAG